MQNNYRWCELMTHEKIAEARAGAARDRLALTAVQARREAREDKGAPFARLLRTLADAVGFGRPVLAASAPGNRHP